MSAACPKVLLRSYRSILLVRAYSPDDHLEIPYKKLFVASDCSTRGIYSAFRDQLGQYYSAQIILGTVIEKPQIIQRLPLSPEDLSLASQLSEINQKEAIHCHNQISNTAQLERDRAREPRHSGRPRDRRLHDLVEEVQADLVMLVAHGETGGEALAVWEHCHQPDRTWKRAAHDRAGSGGQRCPAHSGPSRQWSILRGTSP